MIFRYLKIVIAGFVLIGLIAACRSSVNVPYKKKRKKCDCPKWSFENNILNPDTLLYDERS